MGSDARGSRLSDGRNTSRTFGWQLLLCCFVGGLLDNGGCTSKPRFLGGIKNVTVALGREATLECVIDNLGKFKVAWMKVDSETLLTYDRHTIVNDVRLRVTHNNERQWFLHLRDVGPKDKGFYMCQINTEPMMFETGFLDVLVPPRILDQGTSSDTTVDEGSKVSLQCRADGYPKPTIMWRREDGREINLERYSGRRNSVMTVEDEFLNISQVSREDIGAYLCIARNGVPPSVSKRIMLHVNFRPKIRVSEQLVGAAVGTSVFLECLVEASPRPLTSWIRGDGMILIDTKKYRSTEDCDSYRYRMRLQINDLQKTDYGHYKCHAKNTFGEKEGFIRLHGIGIPSKEETRSDDRGLTHLHLEPPGRSRSTNMNAAYAMKTPDYVLMIAATGVLFSVRWQ
ncbi:lachesin-like isoform X2 [Ornithodoros turicata]|uniref:lachesin-like isoform X2 n=1 Tax=Ornithodoros turicata TaxID=34597 RepID=UPI00313A139F